jgi:hypothetical protein
MECSFIKEYESERQLKDQKNELVALAEQSRGGLPNADLTI